jgi:hypothetical protein
MGQIDKSANSGGEKHSVSSPETVELSTRADVVIINKPSLREQVATRVLDMFKISLIGTLASAGIIVLIDHGFILFKIITPDQRLLTEKVLMTLIGATVVQVGAALAAIVIAVFKSDEQRPEV